MMMAVMALGVVPRSRKRRSVGESLHSMYRCAPNHGHFPKALHRKYRNPYTGSMPRLDCGGLPGAAPVCRVSILAWN
jgi:hypothetical protein